MVERVVLFDGCDADFKKLLDEDGDGEIDDGFEESGKVYRDAATGKYYLVQD